MTDERAPEAPRDERLLSAEPESKTAEYVSWLLNLADDIQRGFRVRSEDHKRVREIAEQLAVAERNRRQSLADTVRLRDDRDALGAENARLRAALERIDLATYSSELSVRAIEQIIRAAALTGGPDGEE